MSQTVSAEVAGALSGRPGLCASRQPVGLRLRPRASSGENRAMQRWVAAAAIPLMILVACSSTSTTSSPGATSPSSAAPSASCVNKTEFDAAIQSAQGHVASAVSAVGVLNFGTAKEELQKAGEAAQHAGDLAEGASPEIKTELQSAVDSLNQAVTDLQDDNAT